MKKISRRLYLDAEKVTACLIEKRTGAGGKEIKFTLVVDGQKLNCNEQEFAIIAKLRGMEFDLDAV